MSEQSVRPSFLPYEFRPEYDIRQNAPLHEPAFEAFEALLDPREASGVGLSYTTEPGVVHRQLDVYSVDRGIQSEAQLIVEEYRRGPLKKLAKLCLKEFIGMSNYPFIHEYHLETFAGGGVQGVVSVTDVIHSHGMETHQITPYDFKNLMHDLEATAAMTRAITPANTQRKNGEEL